MKYLSLLFVLFCLNWTSEAQEHCAPVEFHSFSQVKAELNSPLSLTEINLGYTAKDSSKLDLGLTDNYEEYNLIGYRLMNHELIDGFSRIGKSVPFIYSSDLSLAKDTCRYVVKSKYDFVTGIPSYYVFDTKTNQSFKEYSSVETLLKVLNFTLKFKPTPTQLSKKTKQELLDEAILKNFFKERKRMGKAGKYIVGGLVLSVFEVTGIVLSNLDL